MMVDVRLVRLPVGPRKITRAHRDEPIVYLGRDFRWLVGRKVYVEILVHNEEEAANHGRDDGS